MRKLLPTILRILDGTPQTRRQQPRERGQSLVELALITPLLVIMVVGIVEVGWYANHFLILLEVTRVGARAGTVLTGDLSPEAWSNQASTHPIVYELDSQFASNDWPAPPSNYTVDVSLYEPDDTYNLVDNAQAYGYRDCDNIANASGFYNFIACTMIESLAPLTMKGRQADSTDYVVKVIRDRAGGAGQIIPVPDDIVISAFSLQILNNDDPANWTTQPEIYRHTYDMDAYVGVDASGEIRLVADATGLDPLFDPGHQLVVVGRYPTNANECNVWFTPDTPEDNQSPFLMRVVDDPGLADETIIVPVRGGTQDVYLRYPRGTYEFEHDIYTDPFDWFADSDPIKTPGRAFELPTSIVLSNGQPVPIELFGWDYGPEMQRGFVWTGQHILQRERELMDGTIQQLTCLGSEWDDERVVQLLSLTRFLDPGLEDESDAICAPPDGPGPGPACDDLKAAAQARNQDRLEIADEQRSYMPSQGLVLVEMYWDHTLLLNFPFMYPIVTIFGGGAQNIVISVWAAFPAPTVEPNIVFGLAPGSP